MEGGLRRVYGGWWAGGERVENILGGKWAVKAVGSRSGRVGPGRGGWMVVGCRWEGEWRAGGGRMRGAWSAVL